MILKGKLSEFLNSLKKCTGSMSDDAEQYYSSWNGEIQIYANGMSTVFCIKRHVRVEVRQV